MFRNDLAAVYEDTVDWISKSTVLQQHIEETRRQTTVYAEDDKMIMDIHKGYAGRVRVTAMNTVQAAMYYLRSNSELRVGVLNFCSAVTPGGGVERGLFGQEEELCRDTTLYWALNTDKVKKDFYVPHKRANNLDNNADCIWTPGIKIIKNSFSHYRLPVDSWRTIDVVSCAAPKLNERSMHVDQQYEEHVKRARKILSVFAAHDVKYLILGAHGCGYYNNVPGCVAKAYAKVIEEFPTTFVEINFAIPNPKSINFTTFCHYLNE